MTTKSKTGQHIWMAIDDAVERYGPTMTASQFADMAHITKRTAYVWREEGKGPQAWRVGQRWFYSTADVVRFVHGK